MKYLSILVLLLSGCASIISGGTSKVEINSVPNQSQFSIFNEDGRIVKVGTTPAVVELENGNGYFDGERYTVEFSKSGFFNTQSHLDTKLNGWYFGNIIAGGFLGMVVIDPLTGAMWSLDDKTASVLLKK